MEGVPYLDRGYPSRYHLIQMLHLWNFKGGILIFFHILLTLKPPSFQVDTIWNRTNESDSGTIY